MDAFDLAVIGSGPAAARSAPRNESPRRADRQARERHGSVEWRTFCARRDGEAMLTETQGLW